MEMRRRERRRKGYWMVASRNTPLPSIRLHDAELSQVAQLHVPEGLPGADDGGVCRRGTAGQHMLMDSRQPSVIDAIDCYLPVRPSLGRRRSCRQKEKLRSEPRSLGLVTTGLLLFYFSCLPTLLSLSLSVFSLFSHTHPFCPALGALLLNCRLSFCLNLGGAALAPSAPSTAAFISVVTGRCRISALTQRSPLSAFNPEHEIIFPDYSSFKCLLLELQRY